MSTARGRAAVLAAALLVAGCGSSDSLSTAGASPEPSAASAVPTSEPALAVPRFTACPRTPPAAGDTHLRAPEESSPATQALLRRAELQDAAVRLESAGALVLTDGTLQAGNGYEAAVGGRTPVRVAPPGTRAPVTLSVIDSERAGRRVAFLEVQLAAPEPVRWVVREDLSFVTDGGDGGFALGALPPVDGDAVVSPSERPVGPDGSTTDYVEAFYPGGDSGSGHVCVLRRSADDVDGVLFSAGYGDGGYLTYGGLDADGTLVSVVSYGGVLPWEAAGLPGTPPPDLGEDELFD